MDNQYRKPTWREVYLETIEKKDGMVFFFFTFLGAICLIGSFIIGVIAIIANASGC